jgi:hypothetical protein
MQTLISGSNRIPDIDPVSQALKRAVEIRLPFLVVVQTTLIIIYHVSVNNKIKRSIDYGFLVKLQYPTNQYLCQLYNENR